MPHNVVIVGAGVAGVRVAKGLRSRGFIGSVTLLDTDATQPYDRPPLSKAVLSERAPLPVKLSEREVKSLGVTWLPGERAVRLDPVSKALLCASGAELSYDWLVIATGAAARTLPGVPGLVLRSWADAVELNRSIESTRSIAVIGAGLIGCEVAASLRTRGMSVDLIDIADVPMKRVVGERFGAEVAARHRSNGVALHLGVGVEKYADGELVLSDGCILRPDGILHALGAEPRTDWLSDSGLELARGVVCDDLNRASIDGVYAVGDTAVVAGTRHEHWTAAGEQADRVVAQILGETPRRPEPSYWWSDQYGEKYQGLGDINGSDEVLLGSVGGRRVGIFGRDGRLVGVVGLSAARVVMGLRLSIAAAEPLVEVYDRLRLHSGFIADTLPVCGPEPFCGNASPEIAILPVASARSVR